MDNAIQHEGYRPRMRGVLDVYALIAAIPAVITCVWLAHPERVLSGITFGFAVLFLLGASSLYHAPAWPLPILVHLRRVDHAAIFVLIAGSYTPVCAHVLPQPLGTTFLATVWLLAGVGVAVAMFWPGAPRILSAGLYFTLGWTGGPLVQAMWAALDPLTMILFITGGIIYSIGGVFYVARWPNPVRNVFEYHEVFHTFVVAGLLSHFIAVWRIISGIAG